MVYHKGNSFCCHFSLCFNKASEKEVVWHSLDINKLCVLQLTAPGQFPYRHTKHFHSAIYEACKL